MIIKISDKFLMEGLMLNSTKKSVSEIESSARFQFGSNWLGFAKHIDENKIIDAENSLKKMFQVDSFFDKTFLDIGCGSGLFSLAAIRLGAKVFSFDFDANSVECTKKLKKLYFDENHNWTIEQGSILNKEYILEFEKFDYVYSWGVLHHTGDLWLAIENSTIPIKNNGSILIAIYNYQPFISKYWLYVKKLYNYNIIFRPFLFFLHFIFPILPSIFINFLRDNKKSRGMSVYFDLIDWLGGYPFEVAKPEIIVDYFLQDGYQLKKLVTVGGKHGCNEFVFQKVN